MTSWEEIAERLGGSTGLGVGIAAAVLTPALAPLVGRGVRWAIKGAIKGYLVATTGARTAVSQAGESLQDLYAEAKSEVGLDGAEPAGSAAAGG